MIGAALTKLQSAAEGNDYSHADERSRSDTIESDLSGMVYGVETVPCVELRGRIIRAKRDWTYRGRAQKRINGRNCC